MRTTSISAHPGFDFNAWQALNKQQMANQGAAEAETPDSVTQGVVDQLIQSFFRLFGVNPDLKGHAALSETNVGGGLSLQSAAIVKDQPGGALASTLRYFTRELPSGLGAGDSVGAVASAPGKPEHISIGAPAGDPLEAGRFASLLEVTLLASEPVDVPLDRLSYLSPPATPVIAREGVERELAC